MAACSNGESSSPETSTADESTTSEPVIDEPALQRELLDMMDEDQRERTEGFMGSGDEARTDRLGAIIAGHGWPTGQLVGTDGVTAAWLIAQHADHDVAFQQRATDLMRPAVEAGEADASELALLEDRVAVNTGAEQVYGSHIGCVDGAAVPATPIADEEHVDDRREVSLQPLADYYAEFEEACAAEG